MDRDYDDQSETSQSQNDYGSERDNEGKPKMHVSNLSQQVASRQECYNKVKEISDFEAHQVISKQPNVSKINSKALSSLDHNSPDDRDESAMQKNYGVSEKNIRYFIIDDMQLILHLDRAMSKVERVMCCNNYF